MSDILSSSNGAYISSVHLNLMRWLTLVQTFSSRRPWYNKFRACLNNCETIEELETLLRTKLTRWRGKAAGVEGVKSVRSKLDSDDEGSERGEQDLDDDLSLIV